MKTTLTTIAITLAASIAFAGVLSNPTETDAQKRARRTVEHIQQTPDALLGIIRHGLNEVWGSNDPQAVFDELGTDAVEIVELTESLIAYLAGQLTAAGDTERLAELQQVVSVRWEYTKNPDGTVTVIPPGWGHTVEDDVVTLVEPTPEPTPTPEP